MRRPKVFVDSNVIVSAFFSSGGTAAEILSLHAAGHVTMVISQQVIEELRSAATRKMPDRLQAILAYFLSSPPEIVPNPFAQEVDQLLGVVNIDDAPILAAALAADVGCFVTGDRRFLRESRAAQRSVTVLTPRELLDTFRQATDR